MRARMALGSPLRRAATGSMLLRAFSLSAGLIGSIALARLLGVEAYGVFAIVTGWIALLGVPAMVGFDRLLVRELSAGGAERRSGGRGLLPTADRVVVGASLVAAVAVTGLAWVSVGNAPGAALAILVGASSLPFVSLAQLRQAALQGLHHVLHGQAVDAVVRPVALAVLAVAALLAGIHQPGPVVGTAMFLVSSLAGVAAAAILLGRARSTRSEGANAVGDRDGPAPPSAWIRRALPLSVMATLSIVVVQADVLLVGLLSSPATAGVYQVAARGAMLVSLPLAVLAAAFAPWYSSLWSDGDRYGLQRLVTRTSIAATLMAVLIAAAFVVAADRFLALFGPGFETGVRPLLILTVGWVGATFLGPAGIVLVMTGHERGVALTSIVGIVVEVGLALLLIPSHGADGGAIASTCGLVAWGMALLVMVRRRLGIRPTAAGI